MGMYMLEGLPRTNTKGQHWILMKFSRFTILEAWQLLPNSLFAGGWERFKKSCEGSAISSFWKLS
uniref:Uncharacterized protein n=1 Tax=Physcomitrium patens TaxID=3218 RepID=A0A2K1JFW1_PHYPA|nr:hypothetical protein PHYPA_017826 [Physcomitrium patens]